MSKKSVVNASPLIFLSKAGMMHLLQQKVEEVLVPEPVVQEILKRGSQDFTAKVLESIDWLKPVEVAKIPALIQSWDLGPGESSVLAYAYANPGVTAIIDDGPGRYCAETLGLPLRGTLGLVMIAKNKGFIPAARPIVALLKQHGMYLSESVIDRAMSLIGE